MHDPLAGRLQERAVSRWARRLAVLAAAAAVLLVYRWSIAPAVSQLGNATPKDAYYNLLADGFLDGQLAMKREPSPELAKLADPWDPLQNGPYRLHDATYFGGRYYLYFGVTPAATLFVPYALLTGRYLFHSEAVAIFCYAGFLAAAAVLLDARRRYCPRAGPLATALAVLALGLAGGAPVLLRRPDVWEVPIGSATAFSLFALYCLWQAVHRRRGGLAWLGMASAAFGLAVGARPNVLLAAPVIAIPAWTLWRRRPDRRLGPVAAAAITPAAAAGFALALYNFLRFGDPLQFGNHYQLAGIKMTELRLFGWDYFRFNFPAYFTTPTQWQSYFPFVRGIPTPAPPMPGYQVESPYGMLSNVPFSALALAAPLLWRSWGPAGRLARPWLQAAALFYAIGALVLSAFSAACSRYEYEFAPGFILLAACSALALEQAAADRRWRWLVRAVWIPAALFSIAFNLLLACQHWDLLRLRDPASYSRLARLLDRPAGWIENERGVEHGPLELRLKLPSGRTGRVEPILVTGYGGYADYLWMRYDDDRHVTIGFEHTGYGGPVSKSIPVDYAREHLFRLSLGSLYPPREHPYFASFDEAEAARMTSSIQVQVDDRVVIDGQVKFYDASPLTRWVGSNPFAQHLGNHFTGTILARRTVSPLAPPPPFAPGPAHLTIIFPRAPASQRSEPVLVTGRTGMGDILFVRYTGDRQVAFGLDHWGYGGPVGEPVAIDPDHVYRMRVRMGSLYPTGGAPGNPHARDLEVTLDDKVVLSAAQDFHPASLKEVYFGWNPIGGSSTWPRFSGTLSLVGRGEER